MKHFVSIVTRLLFVTGIVLLSFTHVSAAELTAVANGTTITATLKGVPLGTGGQMYLFARKNPFKDNTTSSGGVSGSTKTVASDGTITLTLKNLSEGTEYYVRAENVFPLFISDTVTVITGGTGPGTASLSATVSGTTVTAILKGVPIGSGTQMNLFAQKEPFKDNTTLSGFSSNSTRSIAPDGTITLTLSNFLGGTDYYVRAESTFPQFISKAVKITTAQEDISADELVYGTPSSDCKSIQITGKLNNPNTDDYSIDLQYSTDQFVMTGDKEKDKILPSGAYKQGAQKDSAGNLGINSDGTYRFGLTLLPSTQYFVKQVIISKSGAMQIKTDKFNSCRGYVVAGSSEDIASTNKRSYKLLAPIPGLTQVLDYDLCKEQEAQGAVATGSCDNQIGDFLNLILKIMIGLSAVVLVVQIILRGYQYMVTDIPFLKISAKARIFEAFGGLLLALSSYLILNTINPKLVAGTLNVSNLELGVESYSTIDPVTYQKLTGQKIKPKHEYIVLVDTISQKNNIDSCIVKAAITVESGWRPNVIGCDENAKMTDVPSRKAFVGSGVKYDGTKFDATTDVNIATINNCPSQVDATKPGYGLDWRFSKGGGLMQKTLFPSGYKTPEWYAGVKEGGTYWNKRTVPFDGFLTIISPEANIQAGIDLLKSGMACGSIEKAYRQYGSGNCNGSGQLLNASVAKKMNEYQICKSGDPSYK